MQKKEAEMLPFCMLKLATTSTAVISTATE